MRTRVTALSGELDQVVNTAHGTEIARAEHRLRLEQMEAHAVEEYGVEPAVLIAEYGPEVLVPTAVATPADPRPPTPHPPMARPLMAPPPTPHPLMAPPPMARPPAPRLTARRPMA